MNPKEMDVTRITDAEQEVSGLLVKGVDGSIYFIPERVLQACRLTEEHAAEAAKALDELADVEGYRSAHSVHVARRVRTGAGYARHAEASLINTGFGSSLT